MSSNKVGALKEGFLVKKSHGQHRWKTRYFVLQEEHLAYYRKDRDTMVGAVPLTGAAVCFPVVGYEKRQGVFKVCTYSGREILLRAPTNEDRQVWSHAIGAVIRALGGIVQMESPQVAKDLSRRLNISDLVGAMQDPDAGIPTMITKVDDVEYSNCFSVACNANRSRNLDQQSVDQLNSLSPGLGVMVVDWIIRWCFAKTREDAAILAQELVRLAHIQVVKGPNKSDRSASPNISSFMDSSHVNYRFSHHNHLTPVMRESSTESSSSIGDLSEGCVLDGGRPNKGKTIKEGFLMKRGHRRKKWKSRRVVLRENPPSLAYYCTSKEVDEPLKFLSLENATIPDVSLPEYKDVLSKKRDHIFVIQREDGLLLILQAEDEHEMNEWIKAVKRACKYSTL